MEMNMALKTRFSNLHDEFVFADYKWTFKDETSSKDHTKSINYKCVPLNEHPEIDILTIFNNKFSNYRLHLDFMMSLMFDYTVCDIKVILVDSDEFNVSIIYCDGTNLFEKIRKAYKRVSGPAAWPIIETNSFYEGTAFHLLSLGQYSNPYSYSKGYLQCLYKLDKTGELISDHYNQESLDHGVPVISLMLTSKEYESLKPSFQIYDGYEMITNLTSLIDVMGAGNIDLGTLILWLCYLVDTQASVEYWTFNQAHDGDSLKITTVHRVNLPDPPENLKGETIITIEAVVCGIMSEGVEAVIVEDPSDGNPNNTECEAHFSVTFCNGFENEKVHASNVKRMANVIFDSLYNDIPSFGWKLGKDIGTRYTGLLCVSDDVKYSESRDMQYVRNAKYSVKYHPYFFSPTKSFVRKLRLDYEYKKLFGKKFEKHMIMYPIKEGNSICVYKSWAKNPETKKYTYMALVSIKDYKSSGVGDIVSLIGSIIGMDDLEVRSINNPINDGLFCDLIDEFMRPYLDIRDKNVCATLVGKKLMVLEILSKEH